MAVSVGLPQNSQSALLSKNCFRRATGLDQGLWRQFYPVEFTLNFQDHATPCAGIVLDLFDHQQEQVKEILELEQNLSSVEISSANSALEDEFFAALREAKRIVTLYHDTDLGAIRLVWHPTIPGASKTVEGSN